MENSLLIMWIRLLTDLFMLSSSRIPMVPCCLGCARMLTQLRLVAVWTAVGRLSLLVVLRCVYRCRCPSVIPTPWAFSLMSLLKLWNLCPL